MFHSTGDLIKIIPKRSKISGALIAIQVKTVAKEVLLDVCKDLPNDALQKVVIGSYKDGELALKASSLMVAELQMRCRELIKLMNVRVGKKCVFKIKFKVR